jgi:hypothetical protein
LKRISEAPLKFAPFTMSKVSPDPTGISDGEREVMTGSGLPIVMTSGGADVPPPGAGLRP